MQTIFGKIENVSTDNNTLNFNVITDCSLQTLSFLANDKAINYLLTFTRSFRVNDLEGKLIRVCLNNDQKIIALGNLTEDEFVELDFPYIIVSKSTIEFNEDIKKSSRH